jgi:hypothetical protein
LQFAVRLRVAAALRADATNDARSQLFRMRENDLTKHWVGRRFNDCIYTIRE